MDAMSDLSIREIAIAMGVTKRWAEMRAAREHWPYCELSGTGGKQRRYSLRDLASDVQEAVLEHEAAAARATPAPDAKATAAPERSENAKAAWAAFKLAAGWRRKVAERRAEALLQVARLRQEGQSLRKARAQVASRLAAEGVRGGTTSALKRWGRMVKGVPKRDWFAFLLPEEKAARARTCIHPAAWDAFKGDYLRLERPAAESCYRRLQRRAAANPTWGMLPSLDTFMRRLADEVPAAQVVLRRGGEEALARIGPKIERDRTALAVMQAVNADGHVFDVAVKFPDGSIGRPVIVGWQDIASGKLLSWRIGKSETSDLVRLSFCDMVRQYGIPEHAYLDNGRAFASKKNTGGVPTRYRYKVKAEDPDGVITRLGVDVHWVTPYNGKAKPIERAWRDLAGDLSKRQEFAGAYLGNSPETKPENYGSRAVPYIEFLRVVADGIAEHNARDGRRSAVCEGRSLDALFSEGYARAVIKKASSVQLTMMLLASEVVPVSRSTASVTLAGNRYWSEALTQHMGKRLELRFDPDALQASVHAFTADGTYIGEVPCIAAIGYQTSTQLRDARKAQANWLKANKALRRAEEAREAARPTAVMAPIVEPEPPMAGVVALHIPRRRAPNSTSAAAANHAPSRFDDLFTRVQSERAKNAL